MMSAQESQVALPLRSHTILGVCEAIGEDFHFNPIFLRVILAAGVLYSPLMAIDQDRLMQFVHHFVGDLGATMAAGNVVVGHRLGLYRALAEGPASPDELATRTGTDPRSADLAVSVLGRLFRLAPQFTELLDLGAREYGMGFARGRVLWALQESGPVVMRALSQRLGISPRTVTGLIDYEQFCGAPAAEPSVAPA